MLFGEAGRHLNKTCCQTVRQVISPDVFLSEALRQILYFYFTDVEYDKRLAFMFFGDRYEHNKKSGVLYISILLIYYGQLNCLL